MIKNKITPLATKQAVFFYKGDGLCIPGLPHVVTKAQAEALGLSDTLEAAILSGVYCPSPTPSRPTPNPSPFANAANGEGNKERDGEGRIISIKPAESAETPASQEKEA